MHIAYRWILTASTLVALVFSATATAVPAYGALFTFGDSLSDAGNAARLVDLGAGLPTYAPGDREAVPIPNPGYIPSIPYPSNRLSNGPVWVEGLAASLGLAAQPSLLGGTNYAIASSRMAPNAGVPSVAEQVADFVTGSGGVVPSNALYVVWGGSNDARDALFAASTNPADALPFIADYAGALLDSVTALALAGATDILLPNIPDLGLTPAAVLGGFAGQATAMAAAFNEAWEQTIASLRANFAGLDLITFDVFGLLNDVAANPADYGLTNVTDACGYTQACVDAPDGHLFWDGIHPTTAGHAIVAAAARVPAPGPVLLLGTALIVLCVNGRRRTRRARVQAPLD